MNFHQMKLTAVGLAASAVLSAGSAHAYEVSINVAGVQSLGVLGAAGNETRFVDLFAGARITGLAWSVDLESFGASWLSEIGVDLNDGATAGVSLFPGLGDDFSGTGTYAGSANLEDLGIDFHVGSSGRLFLEFFEFFDDLSGGGANGQWTSGTLTVTYVPEPATFGLAAIALLGMGAASRRRRQQAVHPAA